MLPSDEVNPALPEPGSFEGGLVAAILARRSHRVGFASRTVPLGVLETVVQCGQTAPSSKNAQPWRFHVVTDRELIVEIADDVANSPHADSYVPTDPVTGRPRPGWESTVVESARVLRGAPAAIFVENLGRFGGGRSGLAKARPDQLEGRLIAFALECAGIGAAIQNLWLGAEALGLKASFMGDVGVAEDSISSRLGLEGDLLGALAVGYSDLAPEPKRALDDDGVDRAVWHLPDGINDRL